jgi:hypothetical protein
VHSFARPMKHSRTVSKSSRCSFSRSMDFDEMDRSSLVMRCTSADVH